MYDMYPRLSTSNELCMRDIGLQVYHAKYVLDVYVVNSIAESQPHIPPKSLATQQALDKQQISQFMKFSSFN